MTNLDLEARLDTTDEWITERTGIRQRYIAGPGETTASLATAACADAMKNAGLTPDEIDLLVVATATPEASLPATAVFVQDALGLRCGSFDLGAACSGFAYSLVVVSGLISNGSVRNALVVGSETLSRIVDQSDRSTAVLFGDAAGAAVVTSAKPGFGLVGWDLGADGSAAGILHIPGGGSRRPVSAETVSAGEHFVKMEGREVFKRAVRVCGRFRRDRSCRCGAHRWRRRPVCSSPGQRPDRRGRGRTIGARPGKGVHEHRPLRQHIGGLDPGGPRRGSGRGRVAEGDLVMLSGFGAGMTWGTALLRWGGVER